MKKKLRLMAYIIICSLAFACVLGSSDVFATCTTDSNTGVVTCTESASASVTVAKACTLTANTSPAHTATLANGIYSATTTEYASGIGKTTLKVVCNDASGFSIYAVGYTNNEYGNTKLMSNEQDATAPIINTGTQDSGSTSAWSMKLTSVTGTYAPTLDNSFGSYHSVPSTYTRVAYRTSGTDAGSSPTGSSVDTTYAAFIGPTQPAGTYVGKVKYTLVHPNTNTPKDAPITCAANKICYSPNANDVEGTMGVQSAGSNNTYTLLASNFSRKGYGFAGWSESQNAASDPTAKIYGPQETITTGNLNSKGMSLYAVWVKSEGSIQDSSKVTAVCNRLTQAPTDGTANISSVSALTDQRDDETYAIAKLADGNCWMIENLRLESTNSDNFTGALAQGYGTSATYGDFGGLADAESANFSNSTTANSLYYSGTQEGTASIDIGTTNNPGYRMPRYNNTNTSARASDPTSNSTSMYSYGNYYTWHAAIADLTYNGTNNSSVTNTSLCPKGWRLPKGGNKTRITSNNDNEFWNLVVVGLNGGTLPANYDSSSYPYYTGAAEAGPVANALRAYPNNFLYSGTFDTSSALGRGSGGRYWSSTASSIVESYFLYLYSTTYVRPGTDDYYKYNGQSTRCIAPAS